MTGRSLAIATHFEIVLDDDTSVHVVTSLQDQLRWEINHDGEPWLAGDAPALTKLLETAFYAGRRTGAIAEKHFDRWRLQVVDLIRHPDDEDPDTAEDPDPETFQ